MKKMIAPIAVVGVVLAYLAVIISETGVSKRASTLGCVVR